MARYIPKAITFKPLDDIGTNPLINDLSSVGSKLMRAKILYDRDYRGFQKADIKGPPDGFETSGLAIFETEKLAREKKFREAKSNRVQLDQASDAYTSEQYGVRDHDNLSDYIAIADISSVPYKSIILPFIPRELSYDAASKFVGIATMGRNNPFYQYTGSEDTLQFDIEWFSLVKEDRDRLNVINSCRWVEALSKSDGYDGAPHRIKLIWGQDDLLWSDVEWIVAAAPYKLGDFVKGYKDPETGQVKRIGLMPQQAVQSITLKRLTRGNASRTDILGNLQR